MDPKPLFAPLQHRPWATTVTVRDLIQRVAAGQVRVPHFQRPLRWTAEQVRQLFDSIWRGYPIGSLLFWKRPAGAEVVRVGGASLPAPAVPDAWWVVDGQQRTTALAAALLALDHAGDRRWTLRFVPDDDDPFKVGPPTPDRGAFEVPLADLGELRRLGRWTRQAEVDEAAFERIELAQQRILDYAIPAYVVETDDEAALRGVFARLNTTGSRMRADEVFQALLGSPSPTARHTLDLNLLQAGCDLEGFGQPPRGELLKAVLAMADLDPTRRLDEFDQDALAALPAQDGAADALSRAIAFLQDACHIPHVRLIPYPVVFVILARWFHVFPDTPEPTRRMLVRWVWRGAATSAHQRAAVSRMREQIHDIRDGDMQGSLDRLLRHVDGQPEEATWNLAPFHSRNARSRIETLALWALSPQTPEGACSLRALIDGDRVAREVFASSDQQGLLEGHRTLARTAANRVLLDHHHTGLHTELRRWDAVHDEAALRSHLIDDQAFHALGEQQVGAFLERRAEVLRAWIAEFVTRMAGWDEPVVRPAEAYLDMVEEEEDDLGE